jgi:hypothetical protein
MGSCRQRLVGAGLISAIFVIDVIVGFSSPLSPARTMPQSRHQGQLFLSSYLLAIFNTIYYNIPGTGTSTALVPAGRWLMH